MTTLGRQRVHDLAQGHPFAMQGLREYWAVVEAAKLVFTDHVEWTPEPNALRKALIAGGWIKC